MSDHLARMAVKGRMGRTLVEKEIHTGLCFVSAVAMMLTFRKDCSTIAVLWNGTKEWGNRIGFTNDTGCEMSVNTSCALPFWVIQCSVIQRSCTMGLDGYWVDTGIFFWAVNLLVGAIRNFGKAAEATRWNKKLCRLSHDGCGQEKYFLWLVNLLIWAWRNFGKAAQATRRNKISCWSRKVFFLGGEFINWSQPWVLYRRTSNAVEEKYSVGGAMLVVVDQSFFWGGEFINWSRA